MSLTQVAAPYPIFTDLDGTPLDSGYLYIGEVSKNPETNPIQVYWDAELTQPAPQPIRTSNGYPWRQGTPALLYAASAWSMTVRNKKGNLVVYAPIGFGVNSLGQFEFAGDGSTVNFTIPYPSTYSTRFQVHINGVYQNASSYSVSGTTLTFSEAPPVTSIIEVTYS